MVVNKLGCLMRMRKQNEGLTVMDAVDNLSHIVELDLSAPLEKGKIQALSEEEMKEHMETLSWYDPEYFVYNREKVKETFRALHQYMKDLFQKDKGKLKSVETQKALRAIMLLASEAVEKLDAFTKLSQDKKVASV